MSKKFLISGSIVDTDADRFTFEDVTPAQVNAVLGKLESDEDIELEITSYGGSVSAGLAICNLLKKASAEGHKTTAHVIGIAASMASAIACACDEMKIDANAFLMIHNPWTMAMGNAIDLRKEAEVLDQYRDALLAIYRTKFDVADEVIKKMLDDETWIVGESAPMFALSCEVIPTQEPLKAAAFANNMPQFMHTPKALKEIIMEKEEQLKKQANDEVKDEVVETKAEETKAEEPVVEEPKEETVEADAQTMPEQPEEETKVVEAEADSVKQDVPEEPKAEEEMIAKAEADKRVSGMQSAMAKQMNDLKKDYEAKIADFQVQIKAKDEELTKARAEVTSLTESLEKSNKELSEMTSAFKEKADALDALNGSVNTPNETIDWKSLKGKAFFDWYRKTH